MTKPEAIDALIAAASAYAENMEEAFPRRIQATDSDATLAALIDDANDLESAKEVRNIWRAIATLQPGSAA
jgi:hypothetical protein